MTVPSKYKITEVPKHYKIVYKHEIYFNYTKLNIYRRILRVLFYQKAQFGLNLWPKSMEKGKIDNIDANNVL